MAQVEERADFLDSQGTGPNFLNGTAYTDSYRTFAQKWSALPMYKDAALVARLASSVRDTQVTLVISGTGSGKTVIVPKVAAKIAASISPDHPKIAITNPKASTTFANAEYAAKCMDVDLGREVGYHYRGSPAHGRSKMTKVMYLTDGMLLAQMRADALLKDYACIIIDEAHERPPPVDFLLQGSIRALKERPTFRVIIMSATIDANLFVDYFQSRGIHISTILAEGAPSYEVEKVFEHGTPADPLAAGMRHLSAIIKDGDGGPGGDILWFVPTSGDAVQGCAGFREKCKDHAELCAAVMCTELYSKASDLSKASALTPPPDPFIRKVIFATNIAESSFTFPGLGYVIDSGLELSSRWDAVRRCQVISKRFTTQAQVTQRQGRVGRTGPGKVYHLYSKPKLDSLDAYPDPRIVDMDITQEILAMLAHEDVVGVVASCNDLLTPPRPSQVTGALALLHFYRLLEVARPADSNDPKYNPKDNPEGTKEKLHYFDVQWSSHDQAVSLADVALNVNGKLSPLGALVYAAMTGSKLSPWTAILFVIGAINGLADEAFALACVLEDVASDPSAMYPVVNGQQNEQKEPKELDGKLVVSSEKGAVSDHATLLRILNLAADPTTDGETFQSATGMSHAFWTKTLARIHESRSTATKRLVQNKLQDQGVANDESVKAWADAFQQLSIENDGYASDVAGILKTVLLSRMYHFVQHPTATREPRLVFLDEKSGSKKCKMKFKKLSRASQFVDIESGVFEFLVDPADNGKMIAHVNTPFSPQTGILI